MFLDLKYISHCLLACKQTNDDTQLKELIAIEFKLWYFNKRVFGN